MFKGGSSTAGRMTEHRNVGARMSAQPARPVGLLRWCFAFALLLVCALGASTVEGATCLVDAATGNDANACCTPMMGACQTIQAAVTKASPLDTISVAAGMYPESAGGPLSINKTLTLLGANAGVDARNPRGPESIVADSQGTSVAASDVVIDGFTFQDSTNAAFTGYGIWLNPGVNGTQIINNIFQNNIVGLGIANTGASQLLIRHNLFQNNNQPGGASGTAIYTDQFVAGNTVSNVLIEENAFKMNNNSGIDLSNTVLGGGVFNIEVRFNSFDMNGRGFDIFNTHGLNFHDNSVTNSTLALSAALRIFDANSNIIIRFNNLIGGVANGIRLSDLPGDLLGPSSDVHINRNNITPFALDGLVVDPMSHVGTVDAECNWWGSDTGPFNAVSNPTGTGEPVVGDADFDCWLIAPAPDGPCCLPTPTATPTATPTNTPAGPGEACTTSSQCASMFCVDGVCCDEACDGPNEVCNVPGREGTCLPETTAPAPALSGLGKLVALGLLVTIAALGLRRWRRSN